MKITKSFVFFDQSQPIFIQKIQEVAYRQEHQVIAIFLVELNNQGFVYTS